MVLPCLAEGTLEDVFDTGFRVTVNVPNMAAYQALNETNVTLDFYRIAKATPRDDQDMFDIEWGERYKSIGAAWEAAEAKAIAGEAELKASDIDALAQGAARIILADVPEYESTKPAAATNPDKTGTLGTAVELGDEAGIYLIIAHGSLKNYKITEVISGDILAQYSIGYGNMLSEEPWTGEVEIDAKAGQEDVSPDNPDNPNNPDNPDNPNNSKSNKAGRHKTGDENSLAGWFALLLAAGAGGGLAVHRRRCREN